MNTTRIVGHRRSYESLDSTHGAARVQRGGTVSCSCGWTAGVRSREEATSAHEAHKRTVATGQYDAGVQAEIARREQQYAELLADPARMGKLSLTAEQVQGWLDDLLAGKTKVSA